MLLWFRVHFSRRTIIVLCIVLLLEAAVGQFAVQLPWIDPDVDAVRMSSVLSVITTMLCASALFTGLDVFEARIKIGFSYRRLFWFFLIVAVSLLPTLAGGSTHSLPVAMGLRLLMTSTATLVLVSTGSFVSSAAVIVSWVLFGMLTYENHVVPVWTGRFIFEPAQSSGFSLIHGLAALSIVSIIYAVFYPRLRLQVNT